MGFQGKATTWTVCALLFLCITLCLTGELRFCYHGPQRILYSDCPGGFIARKPLNTTCMYYHQAEGVPNMSALFTDNVCDFNRTFDLDPDYYEFISELDVQAIRFVDVAEGGAVSPGADPQWDKCNETCLGDWVDPDYLDREPIFMDKPDVAANETEQYQRDYIDLTKQMLIKIINEDEFEEDKSHDEEVVSGDLNMDKGRMDILGESIRTIPMTGIMKLLAKSMRVMYQTCYPFVEPSFYTLVFRTMQEFRQMNEDFPNIDNVPFKRIMDILDECEKDVNDLFAINGTECEDKVVVQVMSNLQTEETIKYRVQANSFRWGRYDPIVEAAWSAVDFVHAYCFDHFIKDMLHYSLYVKTMLEFFIQPLVEKHWANPTQVGKGMTLWEMAYDTSDIKNQMRNLDACIIAAYSSSIYEGRLERPFTSEEQMHEPQFIPDPDIPEKGWTKSVEEYWNMYEQRGLQDFLDEMGYCIKSEREYFTMERSVQIQNRC